MLKKSIWTKVLFFVFMIIIITQQIFGKNIFGANYSWGSNGEIVFEIQAKLNRWGYLNNKPDGIFGYKTYEAVKKFQEKNNLKVDGIVGPQTFEALGISQQENNEKFFVPSNRENNIWLLACLINGEARGENYIGQVAVGAVVLNRVKSSSFPNTIPAVIYQAGQFDSVYDGQINLLPSDSCLNAARDAMNGWDPTNGAIYYWNNEKANNRWIKNLAVNLKIGNHSFSFG